MKSSKQASQGDAPANTNPATTGRRSQPARQVRTNPPRTGLARIGNEREAANGAAVTNQPIDIFPALTHLTDAITALPKDLVRHFTLLKEVDAKIYQPEEHLFQLIGDLMFSPIPSHPLPVAVPASSTAAGALSAVASALESSTGASIPAALNMSQSTDDPTKSSNNLSRRFLARSASQKIQDMLVALEEKNHVISVANDKLQQHLNRIEDLWPYLENEFNEEAKWGSTTHWAYPENRINRNIQIHTTNRRDNANHLTAAAQALAEEAAARSDARKQAVAAKKRHAPQQESDFDDNDKRKGDNHLGKKLHKARKQEEAAAVGLGITTAANNANGNPSSKRRKVDKNTNGATTVPERAMASVFGTSTQKAKITSPKETPLPEPMTSKKRKPLPNSSANSQAKKNRTIASSATRSPSVASSPVLASFVDPKTHPTKPSPAPTNTPKALTSRTKQVPTPVVLEKPRASPTTTSIKANGIPPKSPFLGSETASNKINDFKSSKEPPPSIYSKETPKVEPVPFPSIKGHPHRKETVTSEENHPKENEKDEKEKEKESEYLKESEKEKERMEKESEKESQNEKEKEKEKEPAPTTHSTVIAVTTKSGRASKPSTPALSGLGDTAPPKLRPSRNNSENNAGSYSTKRSQKKSAAQAGRDVSRDDTTSSVQGDDDDTNMDEDEPTYCYCNGVSYGEMVACDADDCEREWFHLECVGLKVAPKTNAKWYCEDCKEKMKNSGKKVNGR